MTALLLLLTAAVHTITTIEAANASAATSHLRQRNHQTRQGRQLYGKEVPTDYLTTDTSTTCHETTASRATGAAAGCTVRCTTTTYIRQGEELIDTTVHTSERPCDDRDGVMMHKPTPSPVISFVSNGHRVKWEIDDRSSPSDSSDDVSRGSPYKCNSKESRWPHRQHDDDDDDGGATFDMSSSPRRSDGSSSSASSKMMTKSSKTKSSKVSTSSSSGSGSSSSDSKSNKTGKHEKRRDRLLMTWHGSGGVHAPTICNSHDVRPTREPSQVSSFSFTVLLFESMNMKPYNTFI